MDDIDQVKTTKVGVFFDQYSSCIVVVVIAFAVAVAIVTAAVFDVDVLQVTLPSLSSSDSKSHYSHSVVEGFVLPSSKQQVYVQVQRGEIKITSSRCRISFISNSIIMMSSSSSSLSSTTNPHEGYHQIQQEQSKKQKHQSRDHASQRRETTTNAAPMYITIGTKRTNELFIQNKPYYYF